MSAGTHAASRRYPAAGSRGVGVAGNTALDHGIDVTLLERSLALSPTDRTRQHDEALRLYFASQKSSPPVRSTRSSRPTTDPPASRSRGQARPRLRGLACTAAPRCVDALDSPPPPDRS